MFFVLATLQRHSLRSSHEVLYRLYSYLQRRALLLVCRYTKKDGSGTKNILVGQLPPTTNEASTKNASKIIPDLVLIAIHLSGSNGVDCALDGADHIVDFKTLQGLSNSNSN